VNSNAVSELIEPIKPALFFKKRNSSSDSTHLVREVKLKYNWLFNGSATKLEPLPEIVPPPSKSAGVSPERMLQIIQENKLRR
jgi:hypothetical protein